MVRLRTRAISSDIPAWLLSYAPRDEYPTRVLWFRAVRAYCADSDLIGRDLDTWLFVVSSARRVVTATWAPDVDRPSLTSAVLTETDTKQKEAHDGR